MFRNSVSVTLLSGSLNEHVNLEFTLQVEIIQTYMKMNADTITLCMIVPAI